VFAAAHGGLACTPPGDVGQDGAHRHRKLETEQVEQGHERERECHEAHDDV
jgi:hypothetical protein